MSATDRLDAIEARTNAATEGPWTVDALAGDLNSASGGRVAEVGMWSDVDAEFIADARTTVPALVAALRAVLAIHEPIAAVNYGVRNPNITRVCAGCGQDDGNWQTWPCPTVRAIEEGLT